MNPRKILLPTDFSKESVRALEHGYDLCKQFGAQPHFVHVLRAYDFTPLMPTSDMPGSVSDVYPKIVESAKSKLQGIATRISADSSDDTDDTVVEVFEGPSISNALADYAIHNEIDLMVVGTHARTGAKRFLLGSEAEKLVRLAPCPVLTVGPNATTRSERPLRILGALDLEETTGAVIETVKEMSAVYSAEPLFIHVVPPVLYPAYAEASVPSTINTQQLLTDGERRLEKALEDAGLTGVARYQATFGTADREVVEYARKNDVDMIVVATHGRKGVPHVLLGSVADRIVRTADCPVLTIHPGRDPDSSEN